MKIKKALFNFVIFFSIILLVSIIVTYLYSLGFHDVAKIDWGTSFRQAVIFGIVLTIIEFRKQK